MGEYPIRRCVSAHASLVNTAVCCSHTPTSKTETLIAETNAKKDLKVQEVVGEGYAGRAFHLFVLRFSFTSCSVALDESSWPRTQRARYWHPSLAPIKLTRIIPSDWFASPFTGPCSSQENEAYQSSRSISQFERGVLPQEGGSPQYCQVHFLLHRSGRTLARHRVHGRRHTVTGTSRFTSTFKVYDKQTTRLLSLGDQEL